jgi:hypothetical protein
MILKIDICYFAVFAACFRGFDISPPRRRRRFQRFHIFAFDIYSRITPLSADTAAAYAALMFLLMI